MDSASWISASGLDAAVAIRRYRRSDRAAVIGLILEIQCQEFAIPISAHDQPDLLDIDAFYRTGGGGFWVADLKGTVVGTIGLRDIGGSCGAVRKMFVARGWRGRRLGIAGRLLATLVEHAEARQFERLYLGTTEAFVAAHRFYERNGFRRTLPTALPDGFPRMAVDTRFYMLSLQKRAR